MNHTQLQIVLLSLSPTEWQQLGFYLQSPYLNKNQKNLQLYQILSKTFPDVDPLQSEKENLFEAISGKKEFKDASYRNICSDFLAAVLDFLSLQAVREQGVFRQVLLCRDLLNRKLLDQADKQIHRLEVMSLADNLGLSDISLSRVLADDLKNLSVILATRNNILDANAHFSDRSNQHNLAGFILMKVFTSQLNEISARLNQTAPVPAAQIKPYLQFYEALQPFDDPSLEVMYHLIRAELEQESDFFVLAWNTFQKLDMSVYRQHIENLCIALLLQANRLTAYNDSWRPTLYAIYQWRFDHQLWNKQKSVSYVSVYNAMHHALQLGKTEEAEQLVLRYIPEIAASLRPAMTSLCAAWIAFFKGDYEDTHNCLAKTDVENMLIKYELRCLYCLLYLEQQQWDLLQANLESFRQFISYNKKQVLQQTTEQFQHLCKVLHGLSKLHPDYNARECAKMQNLIETAPYSYLRNWLLNKATQHMG